MGKVIWLNEEWIIKYENCDSVCKIISIFPVLFAVSVTQCKGSRNKELKTLLVVSIPCWFVCSKNKACNLKCLKKNLNLFLLVAILVVFYQSLIRCLSYRCCNLYLDIRVLTRGIYLPYDQLYTTIYLSVSSYEEEFLQMFFHSQVSPS